MEEGQKSTFLALTLFPAILPVLSSGMLITIQNPKNPNFKKGCCPIQNGPSYLPLFHCL